MESLTVTKAFSLLAHVSFYAFLVILPLNLLKHTGIAYWWPVSHGTLLFLTLLSLFSSIAAYLVSRLSVVMESFRSKS